MEQGLLNTCLIDLQEKKGARLVPMSGWNLPVFYSGVIEEYRATRKRVGIFDVSQLGRFLITGDSACALLDYVLTRNISSLPKGKGALSLMCNAGGGILDHVICFRVEENRFLLVVNAITREKDLAWIVEKSHSFPGVQIEDCTLETGMLALQGPRTFAVLDRVFWELGLGGLAEEFSYSGRFRVAEIHPGFPLPMLVATTGYTGEPGVEIMGPANLIRKFWNRLVAHGALPCGLGARDILRLEMGYLSYGQDVTEDNDPYEVCLGWTIKLGKLSDFVGKAALRAKASRQPDRTLVGLIIDGPRIPQADAEVTVNRSLSGKVTSSVFSPWLNTPVALACVEGFSGQWKADAEIQIQGDRVRAEVVKPPLIDLAKPPREF